MGEVQRFAGIVGEVDALYHEAALRLGQTDSSMTVLYSALDTGGRCELSRISRTTGIRKQTLNSALRRLEAQGAVRIEPSGGRGKAVVLTDSGRELAEQTAGRLRAIEQEALACWSQEEVATFLSLATRFRDCFSELVAELPEGGAR